MIRLVIFALIVPTISLAAEDQILVELNKAKQDHAKNIARIRQNLLEDIDKTIRQTNEMGGGIDYMLRERKGFVENGTPPILPKLKIASENYLDAKRVHDATLETAYSSAIEKSLKAGKLGQLAELKAELKALRPERPIALDPSPMAPVPAPQIPTKMRVSPNSAGRDPNSGEEREFEIARKFRMRFCWIPAGKATLGSPVGEKDRGLEEKEHLFETRGFWLGKYEVTQAEWQEMMGNNPSRFKNENFPVDSVSWNSCQEFIKNCRVEGHTLRLPHEDEWEYACRGGKGNKQAFYWGDALSGDKANCNGSEPYGTSIKGEPSQSSTEIGKFEKPSPHPWGLCDMSGNVNEWCDNLHNSTGTARVYRGGASASSARYCRSAHRDSSEPGNSSIYLGFRIALIPNPPALAKNETEAPKATNSPAPTRLGKGPMIDLNPAAMPGTSSNEPKDGRANASAKDEKIEKEVSRAKFNFLASLRAANTLVSESYEQVKLKIAAAKSLSDAGKLTALDVLAKDRDAFEKDGVRPRHPSLQSAATRFEEAMGKARNEFSKTINESAKKYLEQKDLSNYEALLREKQRFLEHPTAIDLLALMGDSNQRIGGIYKLKNGKLIGSSLIEIPFEPGREYDLHLTVERLDSEGDILLGVIAGEHSGYMIFDAWTSISARSGLHYIDGKRAPENGTLNVGRSFPLNTRVDVDMSIRKDSIRTWVRKKDEFERKLIMNYTGPQDKLSLGDFVVKNKKGLFFESPHSQVAISRIDFVAVGPDSGRPTK